MDTIYQYLILSCMLIVMILLNRQITRVKFKRTLSSELAQRDNTAYGISYAATIVGYFIAVSSLPILVDVSDLTSLQVPAITLIFLLVMFEFGRYLHDRVLLNQLDEIRHIKDKNSATAAFYFGSTLFNALLLLSLLPMFHPLKITTYFAVLSLFLLLQLPTLFTFRWIERRFKKANQGGNLQHAITHNNLSVSIRVAGWLVFNGLAYLVASHWFLEEMQHATVNLDYFITLIAAFNVSYFALSLLVFIIRKLALANIPVDNEIDQQDNVGIAFIEVVILLGVGLSFLRLVTD